MLADVLICVLAAVVAAACIYKQEYFSAYLWLLVLALRVIILRRHAVKLKPRRLRGGE